MTTGLATNDPALQSWVPVDARSEFPIQNLPFGTFERRGARRIGVAVGERVLDLFGAAEAGLLDGCCDRAMLLRPSLNALFGAGRGAVRAVRERVSALLRVGGDPALRETGADALLCERASVRACLPVEIGDYVDFYSSLEHATNLGRLFRPNGEPLLPNWRWIPIGYHGRSGTIAIDGTPIVRPNGQRKSADRDVPSFGPSAMLDIELEMGFIAGRPNAPGEPIAVKNALDHIAGLVLVNDWSARDIQAWEYQPLGPFLGKSFATTISPWVVTLDALEPFRVAGPAQDPPPLEYLRSPEPASYAVELSIELQTASMRERGIAAQTISRSSFERLYWTMAQQLAHATSNGATARPGDLFASGTISGPTAGSEGSLIELTWRGQRPIALPGGQTRAFLEDGDEITLRGWCERPGAPRIGFGTARGRIETARSL